MRVSHILNIFLFLSICQASLGYIWVIIVYILLCIFGLLLYHTTTPKLDYGTLKHYWEDALGIPVRVRHEIGSPGFFKSKLLYCTTREFVPKSHIWNFCLIVEDADGKFPVYASVAYHQILQGWVSLTLTQFLCLIKIFHACCPCTCTAWIFYNQHAPILLTIEIFSILSLSSHLSTASKSRIL